jgi:transposase
VSEVSTVGIDLAKSVFQIHGGDASGRVVFRKKLRRDQVLPSFRPCRGAWSPWRRARVPTIGHASSPHWVMTPS